MTTLPGENDNMPVLSFDAVAKEHAITKAIEAAVEAWTAQDWWFAESCFGVAEELSRELFEDADHDCYNDHTHPIRGAQ